MTPRRIQLKRHKRNLLQKARKAAGLARKTFGSTKPIQATAFNRVSFQAKEDAGAN
jgi:hypothetical protein